MSVAFGDCRQLHICVGWINKHSGWTQIRRRRHVRSLDVISSENMEHLISGCEQIIRDYSNRPTVL
jgi:hypothetical protein